MKSQVKKSQFTEEQIAGNLWAEDREDRTASECRRYGPSKPTTGGVGDSGSQKWRGSFSKRTLWRARRGRKASYRGESKAMLSLRLRQTSGVPEMLQVISGPEHEINRDRIGRLWDDLTLKR